MDIETLEMISKVSTHYNLPGTVKEYNHCNSGHINDTYRVKCICDDGCVDDYIFQKINRYVFKEPLKVMGNIREVTGHVKTRRKKGDCDIITFFDNKDGHNFTEIDDSFWRVCHYVKNSVSHDTAENPKVLRSAGYAFGRFQHLLSDFPMHRLHDTIPNFHNTRKRLDDFFDMVELDPHGKARDVAEDIHFFIRHRDVATRLTDMLDRGELPLRVVHNDTKYNNILMDRHSCEPLCVIDLDTVMPGLSMYDFGDAIRFAANTAIEDEADLSKVALDMDKYEEFTRGFISASKSFLTPKELENMALGAIVITIELASRFLADHINGDKYFRIHRPNHNLERARCQMRLAQDMMDKHEAMNRIILETAYESEASEPESSLAYCAGRIQQLDSLQKKDFGNALPEVLSHGSWRETERRQTGCSFARNDEAEDKVQNDHREECGQKCSHHPEYPDDRRIDAEIICDTTAHTHDLTVLGKNHAFPFHVRLLSVTDDILRKMAVHRCCCS